MNITRKALITLCFICFTSFVSMGQISINADGASPDASAILDVSSTDKGFLSPRMTESERDAISSPATGLMVYQTDGTEGFYYNQGTTSSPDWIKLGDDNDDCDPRFKLDSVAYNADYNGFYAMYVIEHPGSYYFTDSILASEDDSYGIIIAASNVSLDLNGYSISGAGNSGTVGSGIYIYGSQENITIKNGFVVDWVEDGIDADNASNSLIYEIIVTGNGEEGILIGNQNAIIECIANDNDNNGIETRDGCNILRCNASENGGYGIKLDSASQVINCTAYSNTQDGIVLQYGSLAVGCAVSKNAAHGIDATSASSIIKCTSYNNDGSGFRLDEGCSITISVAYSNTNYGVLAIGTTGSIHKSFFHDNDISGIYCSNATECNIRIEQNHITDNTTYGIDMVSGGGLVIKNTAAGNGTAYNLHANTNYGPIVDVSSAGDISGTTNADHPFANFSF